MRSMLAGLVVLTLLAPPARAVQEWRPVTDSWFAGRIDGLHFIDAHTGWIGAGGGSIYFTDNGGATWTEQYHHPDAYIRCMGFANRERGWAGTVFSKDILLSTTNGGQEWTSVVNIPDPKPNAICGFWVVSDQIAYGVGSYAGPARIIKTIDGGATWSSKDLAPQMSTVIDVFFFDALEGFIVGGIGSFPNNTRATVLHTIDGGATWEPRFVGTRVREWGWKITFPSPDTGYISLERPAGPMFILKTVDGGLTWSELPFENYNEQGIGFATPSLGWVGGGDNPTFETTDGGATWTATPWGESVDRFQFLSPTLAYATGAAVYKYADWPPASVDPRPLPSLTAAPNPFTPRTAIRYDVRRRSEVTLFVTDATGRLVRWLANGTQEAGPRTVEWDGRDDDGAETPPGIYLFVLHAGDQHEMGKLVRVR